MKNDNVRKKIIIFFRLKLKSQKKVLCKKKLKKFEKKAKSELAVL